MLEVTGYLTLD